MIRIVRFNCTLNNFYLQWVSVCLSLLFVDVVVVVWVVWDR